MKPNIALLLATTTLGVLSTTNPAAACGGFFCNTSQPVNQAAERIVFSENSDNTVTAVIQIQYQGPAEKFAWLLPIPTAPTPEQFKVSSNLAFARLQALTNPQYLLNTTIEGQCEEEDFFGGGDDAPEADGAGDPTDAPSEEPGGVTVEASGSVGPFDWEVISVSEGTEDPASVAVQWLGEHDYAVPESTAGLVGPYLEDGLFLLAVKLTKTADAGAIRPIVITYAADRAMIPVKLTSVAANDDMGVMTWLLGEGRGVPENYLSLEVNEARLNWFNANANYNQVIIEAADDSGGQGFVTEYAGGTGTFEGQIWYEYEETQWTGFQTATYGSLGEMFMTAYYDFGSYDGFWDVIDANVTLPNEVSLDDLKLCPDCYSEEVEFSPGTLVSALEELVIEPMRVVQDLIDAHPHMTRLYTTLSAEEMTLDPLFTFNPDLEDVSNIHTAERIIECRPDLLQSEAPWRIELPQGDVVRGTGADAVSQTWPDALNALPPNRRIKRQSSSGAGKVLEDNAAKITAALAMYNSNVAKPESPAEAGAMTEPDETAMSSDEIVTSDDEPAEPNTSKDAGDEEPNSTDDDRANGDSDAGAADDSSDEITSEELPPNDDDDDGCSVTPGASSSAHGAFWALAALALVSRRRRAR